MRFWELAVKRYVDQCLAGKEVPRGEDFNLRVKYPIDDKMKAKGTEGKLRLLNEANPVSFIVEQASDASSIGCDRIMSLHPRALHQRVPVILGSREGVERVVSYHAD